MNPGSAKKSKARLFHHAEGRVRERKNTVCATVTQW